MFTVDIIPLVDSLVLLLTTVEQNPLGGFVLAVMFLCWAMSAKGE
jgi:hypothetical protein